MKRVIKTSVAFALTSSLLAFSAASLAATNTTTKTTTTNTTNSAVVTASPEETARIQEVVHQYLLQKPEVILEALQILQRKQYDQAQQTVKDTQQNAFKYVSALFHQTTDPIAGNPNGKVTVVEFFDYQCPHCIDMEPVLDSIVKANPNVRIVFKDFPIRGPMSEVAARAALAANLQGKYIPFHQALLVATQPLTQDIILQVAKNVGLNVDKLKADMETPAIINQVKADAQLAQDLKLFGTPAFFIGKTTASTNSDINYVPGQLNQSQLQDAIDKANK